MSDTPYTLWSIWPALSTMQHLSYWLESASTRCSPSQHLCCAFARYRTPFKTKIKYRFEEALWRFVPAWQICAKSSAHRFTYSVCCSLRVCLQRCTLWDSAKTRSSLEILGNFLTDFAFGANIFFTFLVLHVVQWCACSRINSRLFRLNEMATLKVAGVIHSGPTFPVVSCFEAGITLKTSPVTRKSPVS